MVLQAEFALCLQELCSVCFATLSEYEVGAIEGVEDDTLDDGQISTETGTSSQPATLGTPHQQQQVTLPANQLLGISSEIISSKEAVTQGQSQGSVVRRGRGQATQVQLDDQQGAELSSKPWTAW